MPNENELMYQQLFPKGYEYWLSQRLTATRTESLATCNNCAMVNPSGLTRDAGPFLNHLKCCTYFPYIPNFSLGAFHQTDLAKAELRGIFLPVGLFPSAHEQIIIQNAGADGFGKKADLLCPFFDSQKNQCSVWAHRPGVCTSYFCKSDQGQKGLDFWKNVEKYLNHFEWKLACKVLNKMDIGENVISYCQAAISVETDEEERDYFVNAAWGNWSFKKHEFYQKARKLSFEISAEDIEHILDPEFLDLEKQLNSN